MYNLKVGNVVTDKIPLMYLYYSEKKLQCLLIHKSKTLQPDSTNACQEFMEEHFSSNIPTSSQFEDRDTLYFGLKWDDFRGIK